MKLLFLGDFFFDYDYLPDDFQEICQFVKKNQYHVVLNLETTFGKNGTPINKRGPNLRSSSRLIEVLNQLNVIAVCLANNHTMDFGPKALADLCNQLSKANILYLGAGENLSSAIKPLQLLDTNIFLQNFAWDVEEAVYATDTTAGVAPLNRKAILKQTSELKSKNPNSIIINIYHWGFEYNLLPMPLDIKFAHKSLDAGADLIIGHHPHVVQPFATYRGKKIFYSLGNFYFGSRRKKYNKRFNYEPTNACDYGIGIVFDTQTGKYERILSFEYNQASDFSSIKMKPNAYVKDITQVLWKNKEYIRQAKIMSCNFNPILTPNSLQNAISLNWLMFKYRVSHALRFMKKNKVGRYLFELAKK